MELKDSLRILMQSPSGPRAGELRMEDTTLWRFLSLIGLGRKAHAQIFVGIITLSNHCFRSILKEL